MCLNAERGTRLVYNDIFMILLRQNEVMNYGIQLAITRNASCVIILYINMDTV
jgi:hypothetical protein